MNSPFTPALSVVAVVLGGGNCSDELAAGAGVEAKALAPFGGKPLGAYALEALHASAGVRACVYVGVAHPAFAPFVVRWVPPGESLVGSLRAGLGAAEAELEPGERFLLAGADLPWLTPGAVDGFLRGAPDADLVYPIISRELALGQFPAQRRTFVKLKEGVFTGGNLLLLRPEGVAPLLPLVDSAYNARKNPLALASLFGPLTLLKFFLGRASIRELEARATRRLGIRARAFPVRDASLGADADRLEHLRTPPLIPQARVS